MKVIAVKEILEVRKNIFRKECNTFLCHNTTPALVAGLVLNGELVDVFSSGIDSGKAPDKISFRIASMTKCFAAAAVLRLRDQGVLALNDPVNKHVKELRSEKWNSITIKALLTMQSGLPGDNPWGDRLLDDSDNEMTEVYRQDEKIIVLDDKSYKYSNLGYMLLGRVISEASGIHSLRYIKEELLDPLGMKNTFWNPLPHSTFVKGYSENSGLVTEVDPVQVYTDGAVFGGLWSTVEDLHVWMKFLINTDETQNEKYDAILSLLSRKELQMAQVGTPCQHDRTTVHKKMSYAYALGVYHHSDFDCIGHSGGLPGYGSHFRWNPGSGSGIIVLGNITYFPASVLSGLVIEHIEHLSSRLNLKPHTLVIKRADELVHFLKWQKPEENDALFSRNFFMDTPPTLFKERIESLKSSYSDYTHEDLSLIPDAGLGATLVMCGSEILQFSLAPGEGGKIQQIQFIQAARIRA
jgi:CubicO group peptidase (beta-lactamase class C family)